MSIATQNLPKVLSIRVQIYIKESKDNVINLLLDSLQNTLSEGRFSVGVGRTVWRMGVFWCV